MKLGSLFDGSGGFPLAGALYGIDPVWAAEVEPYPIAVTRSRFPKMKHLGSVTEINGAEIEPVDIITFGSPCQDMSVAGKRAGMNHTEHGAEETTRSGLFYEAIRIIREMREATNGRYPNYAVWENVPGAFSSNGGNDFRCVLEQFIGLFGEEVPVPEPPKGKWGNAGLIEGNGWSVAWRVLDAQFWGVPQRRKRIYLVADFSSERAGNILFEPNRVPRYYAACREAWKGTAADAPGCAGGSHCYGIDHVITTGGNCTAQGPCVYDEVEATLKAGGAHAVCFQNTGVGWWNESGICETLRTPCGGDATKANLVVAFDGYNAAISDSQPSLGENCGMSTGRNGVCVLNNETPVECYDARWNGNGQTASNLTGDHENRVTDYTNIVCRASGQANAETAQNLCHTQSCNHEAPLVVYPEKTGALSCGDHPGGLNGQDALSMAPVIKVDKPKRKYIIRRLTPTECQRLQGFPDGWGIPDHKDDMTDDEVAFWNQVRKIHAKINGKQNKPMTKEQTIRWYNKLHTDSAEYKMWGNGIALPCGAYVLGGIAEELHRMENEK